VTRGAAGGFNSPTRDADSPRCGHEPEPSCSLSLGTGVPGLGWGSVGLGEDDDGPAAGGTAGSGDTPSRG